MQGLGAKRQHIGQAERGLGGLGPKQESWVRAQGSSLTVGRLGSCQEPGTTPAPCPAQGGGSVGPVSTGPGCESSMALCCIILYKMEFFSFKKKINLLVFSILFCFNFFLDKATLG